MHPGVSGWPFVALTTGSEPARRRISGRTLLPVAGRWSTTTTAASTLGSRPDTTLTSASTPPADAPMTTTGGSGGSGAWCTVGSVAPNVPPHVSLLLLRLGEAVFPSASSEQPSPKMARDASTGRCLDARPGDQRGLPRPGRSTGRGRGDRRRRRGGALLASQARQGGGALLGLGTARARGALVPGACRHRAGRARRGGVLLRPRAGAATRSGHHRRQLGGPSHPLRAPGAAVPAHCAARP